MASERKPEKLPPDYAPPRRVSVEQYRVLEAASPEKLEYWHGWMYPRMYPPDSHWAMSGGTLAHSRLITSIVAHLYGHLAASQRTLYQGDVRLYVNDHDYFYPDAFVTCDGLDDPALIEQHDATLIVEVLSPSTADFDRGDKLDSYTTLSGLREYLLLDTRRIQATLYRRTDNGLWTRLVVLEGADLALESIDFRLPLTRLYHVIRLTPEVPQDG